MLRPSLVVRWTPNYFRGARRPPAARAGKTAVAAAAATNTNGAARSTTPSRAPPRSSPQQRHRRNHSTVVLPSSFYLSERGETSTAHTSALPVTSSFALCRTAQDLVHRWDTAGSGDHAVRDYVRFSARRDVLSPLSSYLPPPLPSVGFSTRRSSSTSTASTSLRPRTTALRVVADASVGDPSAVVKQPACATGEGSSNASATARPTVATFSLEELVTLLELYDLVECDDGPLLLQLLEEVNRFVFGTLRLCKRAVPPHHHVKLPLPRLLFVLSQLGLAEERLLVEVTRSVLPASGGGGARREAMAAPLPARPADDDNEDAPGLVFSQLRLYDEVELVTLLVALYRFDLHHSRAFDVTVKTLHQRLWQPGSHAFRFVRAMRPIHRQIKQQHQQPEEDWWERVLSEVPTLPRGLHCAPDLLVRALTAFSVSLFRRAEVTEFVADVLAVQAWDALSVHARATAITTTSSDMPLSRDAGASQCFGGTDFIPLVELGELLLRGVKLCEEMNVAHPLLAEVFGRCCTASGKGVVIDGGEDADVPSDRRVYYDHVTADLVRLNRVS